MSNNLNFLLNFQTNADKVTATINKLDAATINVSKAAIKVDSAFVHTLNSINEKMSSLNLTARIQQFSAFADGINSVSAPGLNLSSSIADLSAITGVTGNKLKEIEGYARESAKTFGGSAADGVESYKLILSQLSPEIAKQPAALKAMGNSVSTLSKTMGGDAVAATEVLTTAMNQYQISTTDPIQASKEMAVLMNIMAAGAKEGSAELPQIKSALEQTGLAAKTANVSFAETNAAIQVLDKAGKKGAEGGVALRNVMATLSEGRFLPKDVKAELQNAGININALGDRSKTLKERLEPLKKIMGDQALVTKLFGKENNAAALALISGTTEMGRLTGAIQGTNTAYEQAAIIMDSPAEKTKRLQAQVDNLKISLFNGTNGWLGYASVLGDTARDMANLWPIFSFGGTVIQTLTNAKKRAALVDKVMALWAGIAAGATTAWATASTFLTSSLFLVPLAIIAIIAVIAYLIYAFDGWGNAWKHTVNGAKLIFQLYVDAIKMYFYTFITAFMIGLNFIKKGWYEFKNLIGAGDKSANDSALAKINADTNARKQALIDGAKKLKSTALKARDEFVLAGGSLHSNGKGFGTMTGNLKKSLGLEPKGIAPVNGAPGETPKGLGSGGADGAKSNEAIATGGTKNSVINITINELNGVKTAVIQGGKELANKAGAGIADELLRVLAMANTATG